MPPSRTTSEASPRATATLEVLDLVARLRYVTIPLLVAHRGVSPDAAYRLVRRLTNDGLLRSFPWSPGVRVGPPSSVSILTPKGAKLLVDADLEDRSTLTRLLKSTSARAHDVEEGLITTLGHDLDVLQFHALVTLAARERNDLTLWWPTWNQLYRGLLDSDMLPSLSVEERLRLFRERMPPTPTAVTYIPDATIVIERADGQRTILFVEVETGKASRAPELIGAVKAAKMDAVMQLIASGQEVPGIGRPRLQDIRFVVWCPGDGFRDGVLDGARRVLGTASVPILATSASLLPLRLPPRLQKGEVARTLLSMAAPFQRTIWTAIDGTTQALLTEPLPVRARTSETRRTSTLASDGFNPFGPHPFVSR